MKKEITIDEKIPVYYAAPDDHEKHPAVILIHEIWGLTDHIKNVADRIAKEGYIVMAPDLFVDVKFENSGVDQTVLADMKDPAKRDEAQKKMRNHFAPVRSPEFAHSALKKIGSVFHALTKDEKANGNIGIIGFCFGGTYAFSFATKEPKIKATVAFYGVAPEPDKIATIMSPMLAFYGDKDEHLMKTLPELREEMKKQEKQFEAIVYPDAGHAFFNDTNPVMYNKTAADDAWQKTLAFLKRNLG